MEEENLSLGKERIKFTCVWKGKITSVIKSENEMEKYLDTAKQLAGIINFIHILFFIRTNFIITARL